MISPLPGGMDDTAPKREPTDAELEADIKRLEEELASRKALKQKRSFPLAHTRYLHSSKEDNWNEAKELKLSEEAQRTYAYTGMEVELTCQVGEDGSCKVTHFNEVPLVHPVDI